MWRRTTAAVAAALLLLIGCGPAPGTAPAPRVEAGRTVDSEEAAEYMTALVRFGDPEGMREGLTLAEEDSTAYTYLSHHAQVAAAHAGADEPLDNASLEPVSDGFRVCLTGPQGCADFTDFTAGEDGLLTGFRIEGQDPGERMVGGHGVAASSAGVDVVLLTAYQTINDDALVVSAEFTTVDDVDLDLPGATYTAPDGARARVAQTVGEYSLTADTATQAILYFPDTPTGGKLAIGGCLAECSAQVHLDFPVD